MDNRLKVFWTLIIALGLTLTAVTTGYAMSDRVSFKANKYQERKITFHDLEITIPADPADDQDLSVEWGSEDFSGIEKPTGFQAIAKPFEFGPQGIRFKDGKPLVFRLKIDPSSIPAGYSASNIGLYYINQDTHKMEPVAEQRFDPTTNILEAKLPHFSSYVAAATASGTYTPNLDVNGLNPYKDYIHNGEEHVDPYKQQLQVVSPVYSVPGRAGLDLKLSRIFAAGKTDFYNDPFTIDYYWYWDLPHYANGRLYLPGGKSYYIERCNDGMVNLEGVVIQKDFQNGSFPKIHFSNGTFLEICIDQYSCGYEYLKDLNGNQITYKIEQVSTGGQYPHGGPRITQITDSLGRVINFSYNNEISMNGYDPALDKVTESYNGVINTILTVKYPDGSGRNANFTDVINRTTSYTITNFQTGQNSGESKITQIVYQPSGVTSQYTYEQGIAVGLFSDFSYDVSTQTFTRPDKTTVKITYRNGTVNDGIRLKKYTFTTGNSNSLCGYILTDETWNLAGTNLLKRITTDYYTYTSSLVNQPFNYRRPHTVTTTYGTSGQAATYEYQYDDWGNTVMIKDPYGTVTRMAYHNTNSMSYNFLGDGYQAPLYQNTSGNYHDRLATKATIVCDDPVNKTNPKLNQIHYEYDDNGNLKTERTVYGSSYLYTSYGYDNFGNLVFKGDANSNILSYEYNPNPPYKGAFLTRIYRYDGTDVAKYDYDCNLGKQTKYIDNKGNIYSYGYDSIGRLTGESLNAADPVGYIKYISYRDYSNSVEILLANKNNNIVYDTEVDYDLLFGKPIRIYRFGNNQSIITKTINYDCGGRAISETDAMGHTTQHSYDELDREVLTTFPDNTTKSYGYGDHIVYWNDAESHEQWKTYDLLDRLVQIQDSDHHYYYYTNYTYDTASHLIQTVDPKSNTISTNTYDQLGHLIQTDYPQDGTNPLASESYTYDAVGNLKTKTTARGTTNYGYLFYDKYYPWYIDEPDGRAMSYAYDENYNIKTIDFPDCQYYYSNYDARNQAHNLQVTVNDNVFQIGYNYDTLGRVVSLQYPGRTLPVTYTYNNLDQLMTIPGFINTNNVYDKDSKLTQMTYANNVVNAYTYDSMDRLKTINFGSLASYNYNYDKIGNVTQINNDYYGYNYLNQLNWYGNQPHYQSTASGTIWSYDNAGNFSNKYIYINGQLQSSTPYTVDKNNRLTAMGGISYTYDAAGALITKINGTDSWSYNYDGASRLTQVSKNGATIEQNSYDGNGMRIKKVSGGKTTYYIYSGANSIAEYTPDDGKYIYYIYAGNKIIAEEKDGVARFYHTDHLGTTRLISTAGGAQDYTSKPGPWGNVESSSGNGTDYRFTGKEDDQGTGLVYFGARWYDPEVGRFITQDPIKAGDNWYEYCGDNPLRYVDPTGLDYADDYASGRAGHTGSDGSWTYNMNDWSPSHYQAHSVCGTILLTILNNAKNGKEFEELVRQLAEIEKNYEKVTGNRIPDGLIKSLDGEIERLVEAKGVNYQALTKQLQAFIDAAQSKMELWVKPTTTLSGPLVKAIQDVGGIIIDADSSGFIERCIFPPIVNPQFLGFSNMSQWNQVY